MMTNAMGPSRYLIFGKSLPGDADHPQDYRVRHSCGLSIDQEQEFQAKLVLFQQDARWKECTCLMIFPSIGSKWWVVIAYSGDHDDHGRDVLRLVGQLCDTDNVEATLHSDSWRFSPSKDSKARFLMSDNYDQKDFWIPPGMGAVDWIAARDKWRNRNVAAPQTLHPHFHAVTSQSSERRSKTMSTGTKYDTSRNVPKSNAMSLMAKITLVVILFVFMLMTWASTKYLVIKECCSLLDVNISREGVSYDGIKVFKKGYDDSLERLKKAKGDIENLEKQIDELKRQQNELVQQDVNRAISVIKDTGFQDSVREVLRMNEDPLLEMMKGLKNDVININRALNDVNNKIDILEKSRSVQQPKF